VSPFLFLFRKYIGRAITDWDKTYVDAKNKRSLTLEERIFKQQQYIKTVENLDDIADFFYQIESLQQ
jgi:hypothetical protein